MQTVSIQTAHLKAAACFAADADTRYYLNGILAEIRPSETRLVATNGNIAGVLRYLDVFGTQPNLPNVIIPNDTIKLAVQSKSTIVSLTYDDGKWAIAGIAFTAVEGNFPDYRRIIPNTHSGNAGHFNADLIACFKKAAKILGSRNNPVIRQNGAGAAQVQFLDFGDTFVGVIMPMYMFGDKNPDPGLVQWGADRAAETTECDLA